MSSLNTPISDVLLDWFDQHGRHDLPWQQDKSPYPVWVSEIMLQQTQVSTVIPYYQRFIDTFPTIEALANAPIDQVLHLWTGLGYYARARNLHKTAQLIVEQYQGIFPASLDALQALPGIGRSTAGAILSITQNQPTAILDGNVKRVLARYHAIQEWTGDTQAQKHLWQLAEFHTPQQRTGDYTQAIMDLGATLCRRSKPSCLICPLQPNCQAWLQGLTDTLPRPRPRKTLPERTVTLALLQNNQGEIWLQQRPPSGIWGGLWSLPEIDDPIAFDLSAQQPTETLPPLKHTFSHFQLQITVERYRLPNDLHCVMDTAEGLWYNVDQPQQAVGLAAPIKKLLQQFSQHRSSSR
ncbi:MAG: A/G-specific adenine glycosylase [Nitrincola lacisaponensis]|uniref:A/G-specific adenine glycosylase n=1 Tax=Nitrincola lacisaponensis TaxID=267850 RepID=UPI00391B98AA